MYSCREQRVNNSVQPGRDPKGRSGARLCEPQRYRTSSLDWLFPRTPWTAAARRRFCFAAGWSRLRLNSLPLSPCLRRRKSGDLSPQSKAAPHLGLWPIVCSGACAGLGEATAGPRPRSANWPTAALDRGRTAAARRDKADSGLERGQPCPRVVGFRSSSRRRDSPRSCLPDS